MEQGSKTDREQKSGMLENIACASAAEDEKGRAMESSKAVEVAERMPGTKKEGRGLHFCKNFLLFSVFSTLVWVLARSIFFCRFSPPFANFPTLLNFPLALFNSKQCSEFQE